MRPSPDPGIAEFTVKAVVGGLVFGVLFGAANAYLGLKAGSVERGILCASGFVAGEGLAGVLLAGYALATGMGLKTRPAPTAAESAAGLVALLSCAYLLFRSTRTKKLETT